MASTGPLRGYCTVKDCEISFSPVGLGWEGTLR